jgi:predicted hotdog family 3-hydroxylacyl-ACP dehydratase
VSDRQRILQLIPHAGSMCLLDEIGSWNETEIVCRTRTHLDPSNPLRRDGRLAAIHLAEYGAQAMAVHGGLSAERDGVRAAPGMLVAIRDLKLFADRLDDCTGPLSVKAMRLMADANGWLYAFEVECDGRVLGNGRVAVIAATASGV